MMGAESGISRHFCQARLQPRVALFLAEFEVLRFLYLCRVRPRSPCCAIVGLISRGALILPIFAPRGGGKEYDDTHQ